MLNSSDAMPYLLTLAKLSARSPNRFALNLDEDTCAEIAQRLDILALRKASFKGEIRAISKNRWKLEADLGATVQQPCVVTLDPVTTRIDQPVVRIFTEDFAINSDENEVEMPEDDSLEPLNEHIDLLATMTEALSLHLPDYPKSKGATLKSSTFAAPGVTPMSDADAHPFAALSKLKGDDKKNRS